MAKPPQPKIEPSHSLEYVVKEYLTSKKEEGSLQEKDLEDLNRRLQQPLRFFGKDFNISN